MMNSEPMVTKHEQCKNGDVTAAMIATLSRFWGSLLPSSDLKKIMDLFSMVVEESLLCYKILMSLIFPMDSVQ